MATAGWFRRTVRVFAVVAVAGGVVMGPAAAAAPAAKDTKMVPLIYGHRGAAGYRPEHTQGSYETGARLGADFIEPDLVSTKDHVLVARHENNIADTTDVADHPEFADRKATKTVDGIEVTGWFTEDFTLAELKTLRAKERIPDVRQHNTLYNGRYQVLTFQEVIDLRAKLEREQHRTIGLIPELKHSTYFKKLGLDLETPFVRILRKNHLDTPKSRTVVQSFELTNLQQLKQKWHVRIPTVFNTSAAGGPYDLVAAGHPVSYAELTKPASLKKLSAYVDVLGPEKAQVIPLKADGTLGTPTSLVKDAHKAGLKVVPYTFRAENTFLPKDYQVGADPNDYGRSIDEDIAYLRTGVDGLWCDQPDICILARSDYLKHG